MNMTETAEMKSAQLSTNGAPSEAVRGLLRSPVAPHAVGQVFAPAAQPGGGATLALFANPAEFDAILPWSPVMPVQGARMVSRMAFDNAGASVAVVLRPCEARAAVELIKLNQIRSEGLTFVTVDCPGTCEYRSFAAAGLDAAAESDVLVKALEGGEAKVPEGTALRKACAMCENPAAAWGDIRIQGFGMKVADTLGLELAPELADKLADVEGLSFGEAGTDGRDGVVAALVAKRTEARDGFFAELEAAGLDKMKETFATCIRCMNCMEACPICYCKQCIFKSPTFEHPAGSYTRWAERKGVQKMPSETLLFHLTRLNHMSTSCIGCGLCDTACPMDLPVATLFRKTADKVQKMLDYVPGRDLADEIPLMVFRENELQDETGAKD
jgi:formate dehydrogenase subunit beta